MHLVRWWVLVVFSAASLSSFAPPARAERSPDPRHADPDPFRPRPRDGKPDRRPESPDKGPGPRADDQPDGKGDPSYDGRMYQPPETGNMNISGEFGLGAFHFVTKRRSDQREEGCSISVLANRFAGKNAPPADPAPRRRGLESMSELSIRVGGDREPVTDPPAPGPTPDAKSGAFDCWLLTAAHCVVKAAVPEKTSPAELTISAAQLDPELKTEKEGKFTVFLSPPYLEAYRNGKHVNNDSALLGGKGDVCRSGLAHAKVRPLCPPGPPPKAATILSESTRLGRLVELVEDTRVPPPPAADGWFQATVKPLPGLEPRRRNRTIGNMIGDSGTAVLMSLPGGGYCTFGNHSGALGDQVMKPAKWLAVSTPREWMQSILGRTTTDDRAATTTLPVSHYIPQHK